jgi:hypothetical protein
MLEVRGREKRFRRRGVELAALQQFDLDVRSGVRDLYLPFLGMPDRRVM